MNANQDRQFSALISLQSKLTQLLQTTLELLHSELHPVETAASLNLIYATLGMLSLPAGILVPKMTPDDHTLQVLLRAIPPNVGFNEASASNNTNETFNPPSDEYIRYDNTLMAKLHAVTTNFPTFELSDPVELVQKDSLQEVLRWMNFGDEL